MDPFIPTHQPKRINRLLSVTLIVLAIVSNVHFARANDADDHELVKEGAVPVFKFRNLVTNIASADDRLFIAGLNYIYLLRDVYARPDKYTKKAFFSQPKNQHLITNEFLNQSFRLEDESPTNPPEKLDCSPTNQTDCQRFEKVENHNRILIKTGNSPPFFLLCGTAYNGQCFLAFVNKRLVLKDVVNRDRFDLIASRASSLLMRAGPDTNFILAHEPDGRNESLRPPILSKLTFNRVSKTAAKFTFKPIIQDSLKAMINIKDKELLNAIKMHFIYGFIYENFAFVLKREQKPGKPMQTRLGRVCLDDSSFFSYTEIPLACKAQNAQNKELIYTYATNAHFGQADSFLSKDSDTKLKNKTLFVTFNYYDQQQKVVAKAKGSVLCAFTIEQIVDYYSHAIEACYSGTTSPNIGLMTQYSTIAKATDTCANVVKGENYVCYGSNINQYVEYRESLYGLALYTFKTDIITSLASAVFNLADKEVNTFVLGTRDGRILKLARTNDQKLRLTHTFKIHNQSNDLINPNPLIANRTVYFTSGQHLIKYPLASCSIYSTCKQCLRAYDNLMCGWCSVEGENSGGCLNLEECATLGREQGVKTNFSISMCPPIIEDFNPKLGPLEGNTEIEIKGENLCNPERTQSEKNNNYRVDVTIGQQYCEPVRCREDSLFCRTNRVSSLAGGSLKVCTVDKGGVEGYSVDACSISLANFNFTKTDVLEIEPQYGPVGGGTKVTLIGTNLNSGRKRNVRIKSADCQEMLVNNTHLACITQGISINNEDGEILKEINRNGEILLEIDGTKYVLDTANRPAIKFEFKPNPTVIEYNPKAALRNADVNVTIHGRYFTSAHRLQLKISMYSKQRGAYLSFFEKCTMLDNSTLNCRLPKVPDEIEIGKAQSPLDADVILIPDGGDLNQSKVQSNKINFFFYPIPKFDELPSMVNVSQRKHAPINEMRKGVIELRGKELSDQYPLDIKLIKVVQGSVANVTSLTKLEDMVLTQKQLPCREIKSVKYELIRCSVDLANETIDSDLLNALWLVRIEIEKHPVNAQLIQFVKGGLSTAGISTFSMLWLLFGLILLSGIVAFYLYRNKRIRFNKEKNFPFNVTFNNGSLTKNQTMLDSPFIRQTSLNGLATEDSKEFKSDQYKIRLAQDNILIPQSCLTIDRKIGTGFFGCVYRGKLKLPTQSELDVAIKTLKNASNENSHAVKSLIDEAFTMKNFKHQNVLTLIGVCLQEDSLPMIILPFMANGDLLTYIRDETNLPTVKNLLYFAIDVGKGMAYLSQLRYVHRDLAARNCMMDENLRIKVADFGLTRDVYERNYYTAQHKGEMPIKWLALESIEKNLTTTESDIWSFGVLLWELMTRGNVPYPTLEGYQVLDYIKRGNRMQKPETCPDQIYEIMLDCWQVNSRLRPPFEKIVERIETIIKEKESEVNIYSNLNVNYVNFEVDQYYSQNSKKLEELDKGNGYRGRSSNYYNSSLSLGPRSPVSPPPPIYSTPSSANSLTAIHMSTFKSNQLPARIEMPGKQQQVTLSPMDRTSNEEALKLTSASSLRGAPLNEEDSPSPSRKSSNHSATNLSLKLNRQNAIDMNEPLDQHTYSTDASHYEYFMATPQILVDRHKSNKQLNDEDELPLTNLDPATNYVQPINTSNRN